MFMVLTTLLPMASCSPGLADRQSLSAKGAVLQASSKHGC